MMLKTLALLALTVALAPGSTVRGRVEFDREALVLGELDGRTTVSLSRCVPAWETGAPAVPIAVVHFVLPQDMKVVGATVDTVETDKLEGEYDVYPVQLPVPISAAELPDFVPPDPQYYNETEYPGKTVTPGHQGSMFGYNLVGVFVAPVQYTGATQELAFHRRVEFALQLEPAELGYLRPGNRSPEAVRRIETQLAGLVLNPQDIGRYAP